MASSSNQASKTSYRHTLNEKLSQWLSTSQGSSRSFRFVFTLMYIGIIGAIAYFNGLWRYDSRFLVETNAGLGILLLLLLGLERFEQRRYGDAPPTLIAVGLLVARMALFEGVVAFDSSMVSLFLYPVIPFSAYFTFGAGASSFLGLFYLLVGVWRAWRLDSAWYMDAGSTSTLIAFVLVMVFMEIVAPVIRRDEESRRNTDELLSDLQASHLQLQAYAAQVAELAAAEERNRLARDIHDSLGHYLTIVNIQLDKALAYRERNPAEATQAIRDAKQAAVEALYDVRRSVGALRSTDQSFSLVSALQDLTKGTDSAHLAVDLTISGDESGYARPVLMTLYRAAQEGLTNVQKYAQASQVTLDVRFGEHLARLVLRDNGKGFDPATVEESGADQGHGYGLRGIRERVELVSGQMILKSEPRRGTELTVIVPRNPTRLVSADWLDLHVPQAGPQ